MRYLKYIIIITASFFAACTTEVIEEPLNKYDGKINIIGRVIPFSDCDVDTRANKNDSEINVTSVEYLIFNKSGVCIFTGSMSGSDAIAIDKKQIEEAHGDITECFIIAIANTNGYSITEGETTWSTIESQVLSVNGVQIPEKGLPMVGRYPDTGTFNLNDTESGDLLTVPLQSLFSKIVVNISVDADQVLPGENKPNPTFSLTGCTVHNVASGVDFIGGTEGNSDDAISVNTSSYTVNASGETEDGGTQISFSFYLPERFVKTATSANNFKYPFGTGTNIREEDENYRQRYKPMLAKGHASFDSEYNPSNDKKATYATISGIYSDHQGHSFTVSYDIYVGNDNYSNFDIVRNRQYNNNIVIQGIQNSSDQSEDNGAISIDHRVNVVRLDPIIVNFRRETLLDSHFEVRPLRIRKNPKYTGDLTNAKVKVEVEYGETPTSNWIGLERSFGNGVTQTSSTTYLVDTDLSPERKNSAGKRKYFTTDLTTKTLNTAAGKTVEVPITTSNQCIWIYVDECTTAHDDVRTATIKVSYTIDGTNYGEPVEYVINQRELFPVTYGDHTYHIEYHEEYLHNYDADDSYGQTEYEGMVWGLDGAQLSFDELSLEFGSTLSDYFTGNLKPYYDFYVKKHDSEATGTLWEYNGYDFMNSIINDINTKNDENRLTGVDATITILNLSTNPSSAVEYCYNKNKRNANGQVEEINWYLPAIDEIEDIVMGGYSTFQVFQNNYYWSCQPSYIRNYAYYDGPITSIFGGGPKHGPYYIDDVNYARATKVEYLGNDRYTYTQSGVVADNYYHGWYHYELGFFEDDRIIESGNWNYGIQTTLGTISREEGNHPRTKKNRIRCVRRITIQ